MSAEQGNAGAQYNLALMYDNGRQPPDGVSGATVGPRLVSPDRRSNCDFDSSRIIVDTARGRRYIGGHGA